MSETKEYKFDKMIVGGYDISQVNAFIEEARSTVAELREQNASLTQKLGVLATKIKEYQDDEASIKDALKSAQKMATTIVKTAEDKSRAIIERAQEEAGAKLKEIRRDIADGERRLENIRRASGDYINELIARYNQQVNLLENGLLGERTPIAEQPDTDDGTQAPKVQPGSGETPDQEQTADAPEAAPVIDEIAAAIEAVSAMTAAKE